jgi:hypothetical protein
MRVRAKITSEIQHPLPQGGFWGVRFKAGEKLTIPEQYFKPEIFISLEPKKAEAKKE